MKPWTNIVVKVIVSIISLILIGGFFMPWFSVNFPNTPIAYYSGLNVAIDAIVIAGNQTYPILFFVPAVSVVIIALALKGYYGVMRIFAIAGLLSISVFMIYFLVEFERNAGVAGLSDIIEFSNYFFMMFYVYIFLFILSQHCYSVGRWQNSFTDKLASTEKMICGTCNNPAHKGTRVCIKCGNALTLQHSNDVMRIIKSNYPGYLAIACAIIVSFFARSAEDVVGIVPYISLSISELGVSLWGLIVVATISSLLLRLLLRYLTERAIYSSQNDDSKTILKIKGWGNWIATTPFFTVVSIISAIFMILVQHSIISTVVIVSFIAILYFTLSKNKGIWLIFSHISLVLLLTWSLFWLMHTNQIIGNISLLEYMSNRFLEGDSTVTTLMTPVFLFHGISTLLATFMWFFSSILVPKIESAFSSSSQAPVNVTHSPKFTAPKIGEIITFGKYKWHILEIRDNAALILSEKVLYERSCHEVNENITWETCGLRNYLNESFLKSFTAEEQSRIFLAHMENPNNPWYDTVGCQTTADRIFVLSIQEVVRYFGDSGQLTLPKNASGIDDDYNTIRIANNINGSPSLWWLRSPGIAPRCVAYVSAGGLIVVAGTSVFVDTPVLGGVRPALWLHLEANDKNLHND